MIKNQFLYGIFQRYFISLHEEYKNMEQETLPIPEKPNKEFCIGYPTNLALDNTFLIEHLQTHSLLNNLGDPQQGIFYAMNAQTEELAVLAYFAELYKLDKYWGYVTHGGTEGNLSALYLGRKHLGAPVLYCSDQSHYSVFKSADLLGIPVQVVASNSNGEMDYVVLEKLLKSEKKPVLFCASIGTTMKGATDNIDIILLLLKNYNIKYYLHLDAALSGMIIPFLDAEYLDFSTKNIASISVSGHKFIGTHFPCGVVLAREQYVSNMSDIAYIQSKDTTVTGSRNGWAAAELNHAIQKRKTQFRGEVGNCVAQAQRLKKSLDRIGCPAHLNDWSNTVYFKKPSVEFCNKWNLASDNTIAHVITMQHVTREVVNKFIDDMTKELRSAAPPKPKKR